MNPILALLLLASAIPETASVSSLNADYNGNALVLNGKVHLDHGLGQMSAEKASLERQETNSEFPFSLIHLEKEVMIQLKTGADLHCHTAELDFVALKGILRPSDNERVLYTDLLKKKSPLRMLSKSIELQFYKAGFDGKKIAYEIDAILAKDNVTVECTGRFIVNADRALYRRLAEKTSKEFQGTITAYPKNPESTCELLHENDIINADAIDVDLLRNKLSMHHPKGILRSPLVSQIESSEISFSSQHLTWDWLKNYFVLKGDVKIDDPQLGNLRADEQIELTQVLVDGKRLLKEIKSQGKTLLVFTDLETGLTRRLLCYGQLLLNHEHLTAQLSSPIVGGHVPPDLQILYEDLGFSIYSDKASIEYALCEKKMKPTSYALKGNVRFFSQNEEQKHQYALADRLTYSPDTKTLILAANPGKKVLLWDQGEMLRIGAAEVHITQDFETKKNIIKGIGNVQFAFTSEEHNFLKKIFPKYGEAHP